MTTREGVGTKLKCPESPSEKCVVDATYSWSDF
jgi:hypothetical protein